MNNIYLRDYPLQTETVPASPLYLMTVKSRLEVLGEVEVEPTVCEQKGACTNVCIKCLMKMDWTPYHEFFASKCAVCRGHFFIDREIIPRIMKFKPKEYGILCTKLFANKMFEYKNDCEAISGIMETQREIIKKTEKREKHMRLLLGCALRKAYMHEAFLWRTKTLHIFQSLRFLMLNHNIHDLARLSNRTIQNHAYVMIELKTSCFRNPESLNYLCRATSDDFTKWFCKQQNLEYPPTNSFLAQKFINFPWDSRGPYHEYPVLGHRAAPRFPDAEAALFAMLLHHPAMQNYVSAEKQILHTARETCNPFHQWSGYDMRQNEQLPDSFMLTDYSVVATEDSGQRHYFLMPAGMMEQEEYGEYHIGDTLAFGPAPPAPDENENNENIATNLIDNFNSARDRVRHQLRSNGPMSADESEVLDREFERLTS
jgi:hypothetical protein